MSDDLTLDDLPQTTEEAEVHPDKLFVDAENPNEQDDALFGELTDGMRTTGWFGGRIVVNKGPLSGYGEDADGLICDGEHRWRAAQEIGLSEVPIKYVDFEDDAQRRLWRLRLNKISGEHDTKRDALEYDYLLDNGMSDEVQSLTRAAGEDLDELLAEIKLQGDRPAQYEYDPEHNVYFEDCVEGMRERLDDNSVDCVITDPPYGVDIDLSDSMGRVKSTTHAGTVAADRDEGEAFDLWDSAMEEIARSLSPNGHLYCFASWKTWGAFADAIEKYGFTIRNCLVWIKKDASQIAAFGTGSKPVYAYKHEFIIFAIRDDARPIKGYPEDVLEFTEARWSDVADQAQQHPTQKPTGLIRHLAENSTQEGDTILDPFMGSATTAVAAIQNNREYVGFEIDEENYRSVIERRISEAKRAKDSSVNNPETAEADD